MKLHFFCRKNYIYCKDITPLRNMGGAPGINNPSYGCRVVVRDVNSRVSTFGILTFEISTVVITMTCQILTLCE